MSTPSRTMFHDLDPAALDRLLMERAADILELKLQASAPGNCLRVTTLPAPVMRELAARLHKEQSNAHIGLLVGERVAPSQPWELRATQVVALRNKEDKPLLLFVPPGLHTSSEDSFDVSTFAEVNFRTLSTTLRQDALEQIPSALRSLLEHVLHETARLGARVTDDQVTRYLLTVIANNSAPDAAGLALYELGLVPDSRLLVVGDPDQAAARLRLNVGSVQTLTDSSETLLTRIYRLKLEPASVQVALYRFLKERTPEEVSVWGREIAMREEYNGLSMDNWRFVSATPQCLLYVRELKLPIRIDSEGATKIFDTKKTPVLSITWETFPGLREVAQLDHFRVEIVSTGGSIMYESGRVALKKSAAQRMSHSIKDLGDIGLQEDLYFVRVRAYTSEGAVLNKEDRTLREVRRVADDPDSKRINESEEFLYLDSGDWEETDNPKPGARNQLVGSYLEAKLITQLQRFDRDQQTSGLDSLAPDRATWSSLPSEGDEWVASEVFNISYGAENSYSLELSGLLTAIEHRTLSGEDRLGRWNLEFGSERAYFTPRSTEYDRDGVDDGFMSARRALFDLIRSMKPVDPEADVTSIGSMVTSTIDLVPLTDAIENYLAAYGTWLQSLKAVALSASPAQRETVDRLARVAAGIDTVQVSVPQDLEHKVSVILLAPTHPLRLWWLLQWQILASNWVTAAARSESPRPALPERARAFLRDLNPRNAPHLILGDDKAFYADAGALTQFWQLYLPVGLRDTRAVSDRVARLLSTRTASMQSSVTPAELTARLLRYMLQHPYVSTLKINVFNPGDAAMVAEALLAMQEERPDIRYQVHLFSEGESSALDDIGSAFDELVSPTRQVSEAQDEFVMSSRNHLIPKLRFARHRLADFTRHPELYSAHISILLNIMPLDVEVQPEIYIGRSSYLHALIQEPVTWFSGADGSGVWFRQLRDEAPPVLDASGRKSDVLFTNTLHELGNLQSSLAGGPAEDFLPTVRLDLDLGVKSLLYQVHDVSDWVLTVDANLGLDYYDTAPQPEHPIYLLDFTPEYNQAHGERIVLTTRSTREILHIIGPALLRYGIDAGDGQEELFLHLLRSLSGRLALRLAAAPRQAEEAISLALARLFLEEYGLLRNRVLIPLDAHVELFTSAARQEGKQSGLSMRRGDLLLVEGDAERRTLIFHLIEVKSRRHGISYGLEDGIEEQLTNAEKALRVHYDPQAQFPDRVDRDVKTKELIDLLDFYLQRSLRYKLTDEPSARGLRDFFLSLDTGYGLEFARTGLVFDLTLDGVREGVGSGDVSFHYVGHNYIDRLVENGLKSLNVEALVVPSNEEIRDASDPLSITMLTDPTYNSVVEAFTGTGTHLSPVPVSGSMANLKKKATAADASVRSWQESDPQGTDGGDAISKAAATITGDPEWVAGQSGTELAAPEPGPEGKVRRTSSPDNIANNLGQMPSTDSRASELSRGIAIGSSDNSETTKEVVASMGDLNWVPDRVDATPEGDATFPSEHERVLDTLTDISAKGDNGYLEGDASSRHEPSQHAPQEPPDQGSQAMPISPTIDVLLGETHGTPQYGILGTSAGKTVGLDLQGVNTICLFGVQGAGKSYTIGSVVEMATEQLTGVNLLPHPLATVIFHYNESQDYPPEFVSMSRPNDSGDELERLRTEYGAEAAGLSDVILLTSADKLEERRAEFPGLDVQSIYFRASELSARDWLFLMGVAGNPAMYVAQINRIMRDNRRNLTLQTIRAGVDASRLTDLQKELAHMRLDFASEYLDDDAEPLASRLKPGRLIIVDLRDELIQRNEALGLFVVMLSIFAGVGTHGGSQFNKLIVFDEAHKYMAGGELTEQVVNVIRQMRHQGVSVLIASQDPPSLPREVIELSSVVILHRFNAPHWLKHIQKSVTALSDLRVEQMAMLRPGDAYVWANKSSESVFSQKAIKIRLRPRVTLHGGKTKLASD